MPRKTNSAYYMTVTNLELRLSDVFEIRHDDVNNVWVVSGGDLGRIRPTYQYLADAQAHIVNRYVYQYGYGKVRVEMHRTN